MNINLKNENDHFLKLFEASLDGYLAEAGKSRLTESMKYSLKSGGKRFRPFLSYLIAAACGKSFEVIRSWCLAIEFIHTYSLIHDDLPCMDNDDFRRGLPTNHKAFGESLALLAGDSLISEAFRIVSADRNLPAHVKIKIIELLATKIGPSGMVGGQVLDMQASAQLPLEELKSLHILKTGNLIQAAALGVAEILELSSDQMKSIENYALHLGLAFQIKDDLLDYNSTKEDFKNYAHLLGVEIAQDELKTHSSLAQQNLKNILNSDQLNELIKYNLDRAN